MHDSTLRTRLHRKFGGTLAGAGLAAGQLLSSSSSLAQPLLSDLAAFAPHAVSNGGQVVVGRSGGAAARWTAGDGVVVLLPSQSTAGGVSADGQVIVGSNHSSGAAFRWSADLTPVELPPAPGQLGAWAAAVSVQGDIVVGGSGYYATRWSADGEPQTLGTLPSGYYSSASGVSGDGDVVVGWRGASGAGHFVGGAFRWTPSGGMLQLPMLTGSDSYSEATAISANGMVAVGLSGSRTAHQDPALQGQAVRWVGGSIVPLGPWPHGVTSLATGVNADGSVIVGWASTGSGPCAFIWTSQTGMVDLNDYLPTIGLDLTGWDLTSARAISPDGTAIAGFGVFNGQSRNWLITNIPAPGATVLLLLAGCATAHTRRRRLTPDL